MLTLVLILGCLLGLIHIVTAIQLETKVRGPKWNAGPRDEPATDLPNVVGRLRRAQANYLETFPFFAALLLACIIAQTDDWRVVAGGWTYLIARAIYLPLYAMGIPTLRTLVWIVSIVGIALIGWAAALP